MKNETQFFDKLKEEVGAKQIAKYENLISIG